jgi:hypothetical protein
LQQNLMKASEAKGNLAQQQDIIKTSMGAKKAEAEAEGAQRYAEAVKQPELRQEISEKVEEQSKPFIPSHETAGDLGNVFMLTNILGFLIGRGAKGNSQAAMSAMNGMLEGHNKGREDLYKREKDIFEENQKVLSRSVQNLKDKLKEAMDMAAVDHNAGMQKAYSAIASEGASMMNDALNKYGLAYTYELAKNAVDIDNKKQELIRRNQEHADRMLMEQRRLDQSAAQHKENLDQRERLAHEKSGFGYGPSALVAEFTGAKLKDKQAQPIVDSAAAIGEARQLQDIVRNNRDIVGREGQVKQFVDRWIKSGMTGSAAPTDEELKNSGLSQDALLFAKRYASYLVNYERSLAPGARGFTVAFQNRFNELMQQNQFNPDSMIKLLDDMQREISTQATRIDRHITRDNLTKLGDDISGRSMLGQEAPAAKPQGNGTAENPIRLD